MQVQINIGFEQLVQIARKLPSKQWAKLKTEVESTKETAAKQNELERLLLEAPTFSKKQIETIDKTRKEINRWRNK
jgi:hypothetical protein